MFMKKTILILLFLISSLSGRSGGAFGDSIPSKFNKKLNYGISFNSAWTNILADKKPINIGGTEGEYKYKPSLGGTLLIEYYFMNLIGVGIGFGHQQRGATLTNTDNVKAPYVNGAYLYGEKDSTNRQKLRFYCWEIPLYLNFHTPKIINNVRVSGKLGGILSFNTKTQMIFHSIEDGFHEITFPNANYYKNEILYFGSIGADINAGDNAIFQIHLFKQYGTKNIYNNASLFNNAEGFNRAWGISLGFLY